MDINPFIKLQDFKLKLLKIKETKYKIETSQRDSIILDGEYEAITKVFFAEQQPKTSVYNIPYIENVLFKELSSSSRDLLSYIIYNIRTDEDSINLKYDKVCKEMCISKPTLSKAIKELVANSFILERRQSVYWINPFFLFKGNRVTYYQTHCPDSVDIVAELSKK